MLGGEISDANDIVEKVPSPVGVLPFREAVLKLVFVRQMYYLAWSVAS